MSLELELEPKQYDSRACTLDTMSYMYRILLNTRHRYYYYQTHFSR